MYSQTLNIPSFLFDAQVKWPFPSKIEEKFAREREEEDFLFLRRNKGVCEIENEMEYVTATVIAAGQLSRKQKQK